MAVRKLAGAVAVVHAILFIAPRPLCLCEKIRLVARGEEKGLGEPMISWNEGVYDAYGERGSE